MKALNYWWPYAVGRAIITALKSPVIGYWMLKGYLSKVSIYREISGFVPSFQRKMFLK